jgi:hypothetical protein
MRFEDTGMWETEGFANESDVEQKLIAPLFLGTDGLQYPSNCVKTKEYLRTYDIGKRKSKKGFIPDYLIYSRGLPCLVIEAKAPTDDAAEALREAAAYALEINRTFPAEADPIRWVVACNGRELYLAPWNSSADTQRYLVSDLVLGSKALQSLKGALDYGAIEDHAAVVHRVLTPGQWFSAIRMAGGTPVQGLTRPMNRFAGDLFPLMNRFLAKDVARDTDEIVTKGYVNTEERTSFERNLETLLRDSGSQRIRPDAVELNTSTIGRANGGASFLPTKQATTLLIGGVGSGKSIFLDRFKLLHLTDQDSVLWILVDFNEAPEQPQSYAAWIERAFITSAKAQLSGRGIDLDDVENLRKLFGRRIAKKRSLLLGDPGGMKDDEFDRHIRLFLEEWSEQPGAMIEGIFDHFAGERQWHLVVVFDNSDKRTSEEQIAVFQNALAFSAQHPCSLVLTMRDETYDIYANAPPLDTVSKHRIFRVTAPRLVDVVKKRLDMMIDCVEAELPSKLSYSLHGGAVVEYNNGELRKYLQKIFNDLLSTDRTARNFLEAIAGKNIRKALEMFVGILVSPYLAEDHVGFAASKSDSKVPEWMVIRALMRGRYSFYSDVRDESYIHNLLQVEERSRSIDNFVIPEVLAILIRDRRRTGELGIEGYRLVGKLVEAPELLDYSEVDIIWALNHSLACGFISAESLYERKVSLESYVKVTASGFYHLKVFARREEYLSNVAMSLWIRDQQSAAQVADSMVVARTGHSDRYRNVSQRFDVLARYLRAQAAHRLSRSSAEERRLTGVNTIVEGLAEIDLHNQRRREKNEGYLFRRR